MRKIEAGTPARFAKCTATGKPTTTTGVLLMNAEIKAVPSIMTSNRPRGPRWPILSSATKARLMAPVRSSA